MADRIDLIIEAAERQGFEVAQTRSGSWVFRKGGRTAVHPHPATPHEWLQFLAVLRQAGLVYPPE
jgi:hypothetical protein